MQHNQSINQCGRFLAFFLLLLVNGLLFSMELDNKSKYSEVVKNELNEIKKVGYERFVVPYTFKFEDKMKTIHLNFSKKEVKDMWFIEGVIPKLFLCVVKIGDYAIIEYTRGSAIIKRTKGSKHYTHQNRHKDRGLFFHDKTNKKIIFNSNNKEFLTISNLLLDNNKKVMKKKIDATKEGWFDNQFEEHDKQFELVKSIIKYANDKTKDKNLIVNNQVEEQAKFKKSMLQQLTKQ